ncbi:cyclin-domain-containing protein, partial [Mycena albidolilacea]
MICYLWFAGAGGAAASSSNNATSGMKEESGRATPSALQLTASPTFVSFTQKLLETTQLSQSVIVLALHYIHRLRARNAATPAQPGSEFRVAVAGLMMANKFLDDNTYTNATWAAVSLIPLAQINTMEREFLVGCDYNLYVSQGVYEDWGRLLRGLVGARARAGAGAARHRGGRLHAHAHAAAHQQA